MRKALILIVVAAFVSGCSTTQDYEGVRTKPRQQILKIDG